MKMTLGAFGRVRREASPDEEFEALVGAAIEHYVDQLGTDRAVLQYPRFRRGRNGVGELTDVRTETCAATRDAIEREARRQDVTLEHLVEHALLVYLADREARRP